MAEVEGITLEEQTNSAFSNAVMPSDIYKSLFEDGATEKPKQRMVRNQRIDNPTESGFSAKDAVTFVASMTPIVGDVMAAKEIYDELQKDEPNYYLAGALGGAAIIGLIPGVGDIAAKAIKKGAKEVFDVAKRIEVDPNAMGSTGGNIRIKPNTVDTLPSVPEEDMISVFPKPQRMFPEGQQPPGGDYLDPKTGTVLSGRNVSKAKLQISSEGKPSFKVSNDDVEAVGSTGKGKTQIKTNLFKKKAGWKWTNAPEGMDGVETLISVQNRGKHYYTLETDFSKGVNLKKYPDSPSEPRLRPTVTGEIEIGEPIGLISVRGKEHPVYKNIRTFNEGGLSMNEEEQMQGVFKSSRTGEVDPVSGNEVPPGSLPEEVRDDIPAMLSEGEYVVPADVLRYYGMKFFEDLRSEAKMGLSNMEANGRMGGEPVMDDGLPFSDEELVAMEMPSQEQVAAAKGGLMGYQEGGVTKPEFLKDQSVFGIEDILPGVSGGFGGIEYKEYVNDKGRTISIPFFNGEPLGVIPIGFVAGDQQIVKEEDGIISDNMGPGYGEEDAPTGKSFSDMNAQELSDALAGLPTNAELAGITGFTALAGIPGGAIAKMASSYTTNQVSKYSDKLGLLPDTIDSSMRNVDLKEENFKDQESWQAHLDRINNEENNNESKTTGTPFSDTVLGQFLGMTHSSLKDTDDDKKDVETGTGTGLKGTKTVTSPTKDGIPDPNDPSVSVAPTAPEAPTAPNSGGSNVSVPDATNDDEGIGFGTGGPQ